MRAVFSSLLASLHLHLKFTDEPSPQPSKHHNRVLNCDGDFRDSVWNTIVHFKKVHIITFTKPGQFCQFIKLRQFWHLETYHN